MATLIQFPLFAVVISSFIFPRTSSDNVLQFLVNATDMQYDQVMCAATQLDLSMPHIFATNFKPLVDDSFVHDVSVYACDKIVAFDNEQQRDCKDPCPGRIPLTMYIWAKQGSDLQLPKDVSFHLGSATIWRTVVVQVHYKREFRGNGSMVRFGVELSYQTQRTVYIASGYSFNGEKFKLLPGQRDTRAAMKCDSNETSSAFPLYIFATRVHTHSIGKTVGVYVLKGASWVTVTERSPQMAQVLTQVPGSLLQFQSKNLTIAARCIYDTRSIDTTISMGRTDRNEMCRVDILYFSEQENTQAGYCDKADNQTTLPAPVVDQDLEKNDNNNKKDVVLSDVGSSRLFTVIQDGTMLTPLIQSDYMRLATFPKIGQIAGLAVDNTGYLYIFHRGSRKLRDEDFDQNCNYLRKTDGAIKENTVVVLSPNGEMYNAWGSGLFYMPNGIAVDSQRRTIWLTDMAQGQAFGFTLSPTGLPLVKVVSHCSAALCDDSLCKAAGISVLTDGSVAIGNRRGKLLLGGPTWERPLDIFLPDSGIDLQSVAFDSDTNLIFAADQYKSKIYSFKYKMTSPSQNSKLEPYFSTTSSQFNYANITGLGVYRLEKCGVTALIALSPSDSIALKPASLFFLDPNTGATLDTIQISMEIDDARAIAIDSVNNKIYIGQQNVKSKSGVLLRFKVEFQGPCPESTKSIGTTPTSAKSPSDADVFLDALRNKNIFIIIIIVIGAVCLLAVFVCCLCLCFRKPQCCRRRRYTPPLDMAVVNQPDKRITAIAEMEESSQI